MEPRGAMEPPTVLRSRGWGKTGHIVNAILVGSRAMAVQRGPIGNIKPPRWPPGGIFSVCYGPLKRVHLRDSKACLDTVN